MGNDTVTVDDGGAASAGTGERLSGARLEAAALQVLAMAEMVRDLPLAGLSRAIAVMIADARDGARDGDGDGALGGRMGEAGLIALGELVDPLIRFQSRARRVADWAVQRRPAHQSSVHGPAYG